MILTATVAAELPDVPIFVTVEPFGIVCALATNVYALPRAAGAASALTVVVDNTSLNRVGPPRDDIAV